MKKNRIAAAVAAAVITVSGAGSFLAGSVKTASQSSVITASAATYTTDFRGFITRVFNVCLNREPSERAVSNWTEKLLKRIATGSDVAYTFFNSDEYKRRKRTNAQIVDDCYQAMLGRTADASSKAVYVNHLNVGMSVNSICRDLASSQEFKQRCMDHAIQPGSYSVTSAVDENYERTYFVYRLYVNCLGRTPDPTGLESWCQAIKSGYTGSKMVFGFIYSDEYTKKNASNSDFVTMLYKTLLGRLPDPAGLAAWTNQLNSGASRNSVINGFLFSDEFKKQCAVVGMSVGDKLPE